MQVLDCLQRCITPRARRKGVPYPTQSPDLSSCQYHRTSVSEKGGDKHLQEELAPVRVRLKPSKHAWGVYPRLIILIISMQIYGKESERKGRRGPSPTKVKLTSNTLALPSSDTLANNCPSALADTPVTGRKMGLGNASRNSIPNSCFFHSLRWPSTEVVIKKSVLSAGVHKYTSSYMSSGRVLCNHAKVDSIAIA